MISGMPGLGVYIDVPTLEGGGFVIGDAAPRIAAVRCEEWEDLDAIWWGLHDRDEDQIKNEANPDWSVKDARWFAQDSISGIHTLATRKIIKERDRSLGEDPHKITLQERGWISQLEAEMIFRFRALDEYWQIFIAQQRTHRPADDQPDPDPIRIGPDLPGGALRAFTQSLTLLGHLEVVTNDKGRSVRQLRVGPPDGDYIVKARTPPGRRLPDVIANPNLETILRYMFSTKVKPEPGAKPWRGGGIKEVRERTSF